MQKKFSPEARSWCAWLFVLLMAAGGTLTRAQAPAEPQVDRVTSAAEKGDAAAQLELGMRYRSTGRRHAPDYAEALKWFHAAADQGNAEAEARIGMMYHFGEGMPRDDAEAARWYLLAANGGYAWAQLQLSDMYQRGVGVPRDHQESRKWLNLYSAQRPDKGTTRAREWFAVAVLAVLAFALGLAALQTGRITGWKRVAVAVLVHLAGIALVLDTLTTYGFWIVFPGCHHAFLATACTQISDPHTRQIVNAFGDWAMINLVWRFMAMVGLALDVLAVWYLVYLWRLFRPVRVRPS